MDTHIIGTTESQSWEAPEAIELGEAALLTLGNYGCRDDGEDCCKSSDDTDF